MIKYNINKKLFLYLASIFLISKKEKMIEDEEELVKWIPVEKLETSKILVSQTYPDEDVFKNINNDIEEMKNEVSEVYVLQDKKQDKKINKVKDIQLNIPEKKKKSIHVDMQKDIKEDKNKIVEMKVVKEK